MRLGSRKKSFKRRGLSDALGAILFLFIFLSILYALASILTPANQEESQYLASQALFNSKVRESLDLYPMSVQSGRVVGIALKNTGSADVTIGAQITVQGSSAITIGGSPSGPTNYNLKLSIVGTQVTYSWSNSNPCGSFTQPLPGGALWDYAANSGTPCTGTDGSTGTITVTAMDSGGDSIVCTDSNGAANFNGTPAQSCSATATPNYPAAGFSVLAFSASNQVTIITPNNQLQVYGYSCNQGLSCGVVAADGSIFWITPTPPSQLYIVSIQADQGCLTGPLPGVYAYPANSILYLSSNSIGSFTWSGTFPTVPASTPLRVAVTQNIAETCK